MVGVEIVQGKHEIVLIFDGYFSVGVVAGRATGW